MKKAGAVLLGLGVVVLAAAVAWMTVGIDMTLKIPKGQAETAEYAGEFVFYVDPITYRPLAPGREIRLPAEIERHVFTVDDQFSGDRAVIQEDVKVDAGIVKKVMTSVYVLDRKGSFNVADERAYSWSPENVQDRSGFYYPLFPMGMKEGEGYLTWKAEIGKEAAAAYAGRSTVDGLEVFLIEGSLTDEPLVPFYVETRGFPESVPFEQLAAGAAYAGADLRALVDEALSGLEPGDRQALEEALSRPVPVRYYLTSYKMVGVEPTAGFPVTISDAEERVTMRPDLSSMPALASLEAGPTGPAVAALLSRFESLPAQTVYTQTYTQTEESIRESADIARSNLRLFTLARVVVPAVSFSLGGLLAAAGLVMLARRKKPAAS